MGVVTDREKAIRSKCTCYQIGPTRQPEDLLCFSPGIVGTLNNDQDVLFCKNKEVKTPTPAMKERLDKFQAAIDAAQERYAEKHDEWWWTIVGEELAKRGIEA